jgi:hypothetical protein
MKKLQVVETNLSCAMEKRAIIQAKTSGRGDANRRLDLAASMGD